LIVGYFVLLKKFFVKVYTRKIPDGFNYSRPRWLSFAQIQRVSRYSLNVVPDTDYEYSSPLLGYTKVASVEYANGLSDGVARGFQFVNELVQNAASLPREHAWHVLHNESSGANRLDHSSKLSDQRIPRVLAIAQAHIAEPLARRTAKHQIDLAKLLDNVLDISKMKILNRFADGSTIGKVPLVGGDVVTIDVRSPYDIEASLLEAQRHPSRTTEEVDGNWPTSPLSFVSTAFGCLSNHV